MIFEPKQDRTELADYWLRYGVMIAAITLGFMDTLGLTGVFYDAVIALWAIWRWQQVRGNLDN